MLTAVLDIWSPAQPEQASRGEERADSKAKWRAAIPSDRSNPKSILYCDCLLIIPALAGSADGDLHLKEATFETSTLYFYFSIATSTWLPVAGLEIAVSNAPNA
jgi:hypothetical protein